MPVFNEADGIYNFLKELENIEQLKEIIIVNDASTDQTIAVVNDIFNYRKQITIITNKENLGHGPSMLKALRAGLSTKYEIIISIDGDGQFFSNDVEKIFNFITENEFVDIVEGVRVSRNDPLFRKIVSFFTQTLIFLRTGIFPLDANTPLRAYRVSSLKVVLSELPEKLFIPNLFISLISRKRYLNIREIKVVSRSRLGNSVAGTSWNSKKGWLPSKKFIIFCTRAIWEWLTTKINKS